MVSHQCYLQHANSYSSPQWGSCLRWRGHANSAVLSTCSALGRRGELTPATTARVSFLSFLFLRNSVVSQLLHWCQSQTSIAVFKNNHLQQCNITNMQRNIHLLTSCIDFIFYNKFEFLQENSQSQNLYFVITNFSTENLNWMAISQSRFSLSKHPLNFHRGLFVRGTRSLSKDD